MQGKDFSESQVRDMTAYFAIRAFMNTFLLFGYYYSIQQDINYIQFFITTLLLFIPFALDYYPRQHEDELEIKLRSLGILIPSVVISVVLIIGILNGEPSFWSRDPYIWLKYACFFAGIIIVILAILDYNNYTRRSKSTQKMKLHASEYIEESKSEAIEERFKRNEINKREGLKKVALQREKNPKGKIRR